jgi:hypothetical protein
LQVLLKLCHIIRMAFWNIYCTRAATGIGAGVTTACVKYIRVDEPHVMAMIDSDQTKKIFFYLCAYGGSAVVFMILGAVAVLYSAVDNIRKMFAIGLSAPALLATGLSGDTAPQLIHPEKTGWFLEQIISPAYAQTVSSPECVGDGPFFKGLKQFWGWRDSIVGYSVVVGSYKEPAQAAAKVAAVNAEDSSMKAHVGPRRCDNDYYPVVVGDMATSLEQAKKLQAKAENLNAVEDAYISPVPAPR